MSATECKWVASDRQRVIPGEHYDTCEGDCAGCWPCPERHCLSCHYRHAEVTCTTCLNDARQDLGKIGRLCGFPLLEEMLMRGVASEAAMLVGPAADVEAWQYRAVSVGFGRVDGAYLNDCQDEAHPLWVLGWIENEWREAFDQRTNERVTIKAAAEYIGSMLHVVANMVQMPDGSQAPEFSDAKGRLAACRAHLENVLSEGDRDETGAPCPACRERGEANPPALVKDYETKDVSGAGDRWRCTRCKSWWSEADYRLRVGADHIQHAEELTATDMVARTRVAAGTIRRWASRTTVRRNGETVELPPVLRASGKSHDGRNLYRVADVIALRNTPVGDVA